MSASSIVTIEKNKRFSESVLWEMQREYFDKEGINAWVKQVPFYVTSNPHIANAYANIAMDFMRDWLAKDPSSINESFYLLELGTGSGMFSFYVVKTLLQLKQELGLTDLKFCYVMSDFTQHNLEYWVKHEALIPFVEEGMLDFAIYNLENDDDIKLHHSGQTISKETIKNPMIVCGNYIFDTVSHDAFTMKEGMLHESLVTLTTPEDNMSDGKPKNWDNVDIKHDARLINPEAYYEDPDFKTVLQSYRGRLHNTNFLVPIAGLRAIKKLMAASNDRLLLISSDKAYSHIDELENLRHPSLAFHGSFSMMVNYDAIAEYFKAKGGDSHLQSHRRGLKTNVFCLGADFDELPNMRRSVNTYVEGFAPADYFILHRHISDHFKTLEAPLLATHMEVCLHDPYMFHRLAPRINEIINDTDTMTRAHFMNMMPLIDENYYFMPASHDTMFDIGIFYHTVKEYDHAIEYYERSEALFGEQFNLYYNMALCHYYVGHNDRALTLFKRSDILEPNNPSVKEWLDFMAGTGERPV
jgi:tetratricopeptide (TPR) repeat protein